MVCDVTQIGSTNNVVLLPSIDTTNIDTYSLRSTTEAPWPCQKYLITGQPWCVLVGFQPSGQAMLIYIVTSWHASDQLLRSLSILI